MTAAVPGETYSTRKPFLIPACLEPQPAKIPAKLGNQPIHAEIFGVDDASYFHIVFYEKDILDDYETMHGRMVEAVMKEEFQNIPDHHFKRSGFFCIVEHSGRRGGVFARGRVVKFDSVKEDVTVHLIDDFMDVTVKKSNLYSMPDDILSFPLFCLKCRLAEMDCFLENPFLKILYEEHMKNQQGKPGSRRCTVEAIDVTKNTPVVRLKNVAGTDLTSLLQEYIPVLSKMSFPEQKVPTQVYIVDCDETGKIWFQSTGKADLIRVIKSRLQLFYYGGLRKRFEPTVIEKGSWKHYYFSGPGELYVAKHAADDELYRVRLLERNWGTNTAEVHFVDYGFTATVNEEAMIPAHWIDPNLSFIAPQCLAVKFMGTADKSETKPFNVNRFWKYVNMDLPSFIVLRDYGLSDLRKHFKGLIVPEADVLIRCDAIPGKLVYSLYQIFNSPRKIKSGSEESSTDSKGSESGYENSLMDETNDFVYFSNNDSSPGEESPDSAFGGSENMFGIEDLGADRSWVDWMSIKELAEVEACDAKLEEEWNKPLSLLAPSYYRQLRLVGKH